MRTPYQIAEFNQMNVQKPCIYRDELELITKDFPETNCCKANSQVLDAKFFCKKFNKYLQFNTSMCWLCKERKENV